MPLVLPSIIANTHRAQQPFVLLQSSIAQSCLPVLRSLISESKNKVLLFCFLHRPSSLVDDASISRDLQIFDLTDRVPGYCDVSVEWRQYVLNTLGEGTTEPLTVVLDSVDALMSNLGSLSVTLLFLTDLLANVLARGARSRLIVHLLSSSPLRVILEQTRFSGPLTSLTAHPPVLITHVAAEYMTPPPPLTSAEKFWNIFIPIAQRQHESEKLVFGEGSQGCGGEEIVVEVLVRGADDASRRRGMERVLEGWITATASPCELSQLESLKKLWSRRSVEQSAPDPTRDVSFNLNLTPAQQRSRSQVPLPYLPETQTTVKSDTGAIFYDPDSADDIDDDDPDEDLDI